MLVSSCHPWLRLSDVYPIGGISCNTSSSLPANGTRGVHATYLNLVPDLEAILLGSTFVCTFGRALSFNLPRLYFVRIVYAIIYTLFLAFGTTIGTTIYGALDSNATSALTCSTTMPFYWQVAFVIPFTFCWVLVSQGPWAKMPVMLVVTLAGWLVNHFANNAESLIAAPQIPQALGTLTAGILANLDSRLRHGLAVALLHPAIFIQVPGSLAASGGFLSGLRVADQITGENGTATGTDNSREALSPALNAGYSMIEIAIGTTVGLSVSALVVYPFRQKKGKSGLFSF